MHKKIKKNSFCDVVFVSLFKADGPTTLCSGRRWRGLYAGRDLGAWWHTSARAGRWRSPAAPLKAGRWAAASRTCHIENPLSLILTTVSILTARITSKAHTNVASRIIYPRFAGSTCLFYQLKCRSLLDGSGDSASGRSGLSQSEWPWPPDAQHPLRGALKGSR